ncbi:MAG: ferrous iron transport protein B [Theionarchaea archaeon]|nr:ferrous iron transport protein B [Theionarchaea archaeon]
MIVAMAGQPNSGKSTLFNQIAGYKASTSLGRTVTCQKTTVHFMGQNLDIVDLPGTYSLTSFDAAELEARKYLLKNEADVIINVMDASLLSRSLEFTIQLSELGIPMIVCLNMIDEAERKGISINSEALHSILGVAVVPTVATKGKGVRDVFQAAINSGKSQRRPERIEYSKDVEEIIESLGRELGYIHAEGVPPRVLYLKLLEHDEYFLGYVEPSKVETVKKYQKMLEDSHGRPSDVVISSERHAQAMNISEKASIITEPKVSLRDRVDSILMHKYGGYISLAVILYLFFNIIFGIGDKLESLISSIVEPLIDYLPYYFGGIILVLIQGAVRGLTGGIGIVLPYLVPFLIGLAVMEETRYLPRIAFLTDAFLHKIGLHGKAVIPLILGYGCTVPAIMCTRILESKRERFITATISTFIPCAARTTIILGLVAFFISPNAALALYIFNIGVLILIGLVLSQLMPETSLGLILEIPPYQIPSVKRVLLRVWLEVREFIYIAWPFLIGGSVLLSFLTYMGLDSTINTILSPLTLLLGLPASVGIVLIFGMLKRELSLVMLIQVLGTSHLLNVLTRTQILTFTVFVVFYIPCLATLSVLAKEFGLKKTGYIAVITLGLAVLLAVLVRIGGSLFAFW